MEIVVLVQEVYHRRIMKELVVLKVVVVVVVVDVMLVVKVGEVTVVVAVVVVCHPVVVVDVIRTILDDHLVRLEDLHIMGTVRAEGNNITHRKVCSTNQCDLETIPNLCFFAAFNFCYRCAVFFFFNVLYHHIFICAHTHTYKVNRKTKENVRFFYLFIFLYFFF